MVLIEITKPKRPLCSAAVTTYCFGRLARTNGSERTDNPYNRSSMPLSHVGWEDGWLSRNHELMTAAQQKDLEDGIR